MPSIKGFTCSLTIEGHDDPAIEHGKKQEGSDYVSAYVIAEGRKRFSLTVSGEEYIHPALDVAVWIDGKYQDGRIMDSLSEKKFEFHEKFTGKEEKHGRKIVKRLWKFGELNVVNERTIDCENERDVLLNLGTIEIVILRCDDSNNDNDDDDDDDDDDSPEPPDVQPHPRAKEYWNNWETDQNASLQKKGKGKPVKPTTQGDAAERPIYETHLKGRDIRHRVITEKGFNVQRRIREKTVGYLDSFENPYCIMVLKYRSRATLQNMDLVPRTPSPTPSSALSSPSLLPPPPQQTDEERRLERLSRDEILRELLALKRARAESTGARIKQEEREEREQEERARKRAKVKKELIEPGDKLIMDLIN